MGIGIGTNTNRVHTDRARAGRSRPFANVILTLFAAWPAVAQQEFIVNSASNYVDLVRGAAWGQGVNNFWTLNTISTDEGMCITVVNNNPTQFHTFHVVVQATQDQRIASYNGGPPAKWNLLPLFTASSNMVSGPNGAATKNVNVGPSGVGQTSQIGLYFKTGGSARVSIQFSTSTTAAGSPDTADIFAVHQVNSSSCGVSLIGDTINIGSINGTPVNSFDGNLPVDISGQNQNVGDNQPNSQNFASVNVSGSLVPLTNFNYNWKFNGATWDRELTCSLQLPFNLTAAGNTQIIPAGSGVLRVCHISFSTTASEDVKITQGTGANCITGPADVTGLFKSIQSMALDFGNDSPLRSGANQALCLNQSAAQNLGGVVIYAPAY